MVNPEPYFIKIKNSERYRQDVKLCLESMGEPATTGNLRKILQQSPGPIDFTEWADRIWLKNKLKQKKDRINPV